MLIDKLLFTKNVQKAKKEIQDLQGKVTQQFSDSVIIARISESIDLSELEHSNTNPIEPLDEISQLAVDAWNTRDKKSKAEESLAKLAKPKAIKWDSKGYKLPKKIIPESDTSEDKSPEKKSNQKSTGTGTSLYMRGTISVGLVVVSGQANNLTFSDAENIEVVSEVMEALTFLSNEAPPDANVSFVYNIHFITVNAQANATCDSYEACESIWRDPALEQMGYSSGYSGCVEYAKALQKQKNIDWSFVAFITKYPLHHFAYAGGVRLCMEYTNDGWGTALINRVFAHETCHIFGAADEYGTCSCSISGYYKVPNKNCVNCTADQIDCLMNANTLSLCFWSKGQIGWSSWAHLSSNRPVWADNVGWGDVTNYSTIQAVAVDNDLYLLARANAGMQTWKFNKNNNSWSRLSANSPAWADNVGWADVTNYSTIQAIAVGNELYLLARANAGMQTWKFNKNNNSWSRLSVNSPAWADNVGWADVTNYSTIQAVAVGNDLYLLARANAGMQTYKFNKDNNTWSRLAANSPALADNVGWADVTNYSTIQALAVGNDLYLLARANAGMQTYKFNKNNNSWSRLIANNPAWSDNKGWADITNYSTIKAVAVGDDLYLLARANAGMHTLLFNKTDNAWIYIGVNSPVWSDSLGWNDLSNYSTIQSAVADNTLYLLARANAGITTYMLNRIV